MNGYLRVPVAMAVVSLALTAGPALAAGNATIDALQQTPVSLFTYGLSGLEDGIRDTFVRENPPPFATFVAPLSGKMADIVTVIYAQDADTITINLVKIDKLPVARNPLAKRLDVMPACNSPLAGSRPAYILTAAIDC